MAFLPAAASAATSAWGPPYRACHPSPTTRPPRTTTAPTMGFGAVCPQPRRASVSARFIHARSRSPPVRRPCFTRLEREAEPTREVRVRCARRLVEVVERRGERPAAHLAVLRDQLEDEEI